MTTLVLVDNGGSVVEYMAAEEEPQQACCPQTEPSQCDSVQPALTLEAPLHLCPSALQEGDCEGDLELEGEVEDVCEAEEEEEYPAVIDEEMCGASAAQVLVLEDAPYLIEEAEASSAAGTMLFLYISNVGFSFGFESFRGFLVSSGCTICTS